jgi:hypothetical protein
MKRMLFMVVVGLLLSASVAATPAAAAPERVSIQSALSLCNEWRPHTGDTVIYANYYYLSVYVAKAQCVADDPNYSGNHYYCVRVYSDGSEHWTPNCLEGFG